MIGLLFGFIYLYVVINYIFGLDWRFYFWYSLFVVINIVFVVILFYYSDMFDDYKVLGIIEGDWWVIIWLVWGVLWFIVFIENILKIFLGKFILWFVIIEGILIVWIFVWLFFI